MKLCSSDNHYNMAPQIVWKIKENNNKNNNDSNNVDMLYIITHAF